MIGLEHDYVLNLCNERRRHHVIRSYFILFVRGDEVTGKKEKFLDKTQIICASR